MIQLLKHSYHESLLFKNPSLILIETYLELEGVSRQWNMREIIKFFNTFATAFLGKNSRLVNYFFPKWITRSQENI